MDGGMAYDFALYNTPTAFYACAWDTGRAAVLQQPIDTLTYFGRGVLRIGNGHDISLEVTGSDASSAKIFSHPQLSANTSNLPIAYPLNATTAATYNQVFNAIRAAFPNPAQQAALDARYWLPIAYRWRCIACGPREYETDTTTFRAALGVDGPLWDGWDYRAGASYAKSEASSLLGSGYYFRGTLANGAPDPLAPTAPGAPTPGLVGVMNAGLLNPFSIDQSPAGLAALQAVSAEGATLYGGRYEVRQFDASVSGGLFELPGGTVQMALGVDYRQETYEFNGSPAAAAGAPVIFLAAFDNVNALTPKKRNVLAGYGEVLFPILDELDVTAAARVDEYTGFGSTVNPKFTARYRPWEPVMFRASYNTGFRVPTFNQIFNGITESPSTGSQVVDPVKCPSLVVSTTDPNCANITPTILTGGNLTLGPETANQYSAGIVITPAPMWSLAVDFWSINTDNTITELTLNQLLQNAALFPERFIRDPANNILAIDRTFLNAGGRRTQGVEVALRGGHEFDGGDRVLIGVDGTYMLKRKERLTEAAPFGTSLIGVFSLAGDLSLRWKHNAFVSFQTDDVTLTLTQIYRHSYKNFGLPSLANNISATRPDYNERVDPYMIYNFSVSWTGLSPDMRFTAGVRNLFDTDPPFAITYDSNTGAGSSWEPRVADPRGRSFTFAAEFKF
jgi:iron complex outermembrane receptor protein